MNEFGDMYDPCSSPSSICRGNPMLAAMDPIEQFLDHIDDESFMGQFLSKSPLPNGELFPELDSGVNVRFPNNDVNVVESNHMVPDTATAPVSRYLIPVAKSSAPPSPPRIAQPETDNVPQSLKAHISSVVPRRTPTACIKPERQQASESAFADDLKLPVTQSSGDPAPGPKRGRPMKITSYSKQALYARKYREKNKLAINNYERRVMEQGQEISMLRREKIEILDRFNGLKRQLEEMKQLMLTHGSLASVPALDSELKSLLSFVSDPAVAQTIQSYAASDGVCVHIRNGECVITVCEGCNSPQPKEKEIHADVNSTGLFNDDFSEIERYIH